MKTINATQIPEIKDWITSRENEQVADCIGPLLILIYEWAEYTGRRILSTTSFNHALGAFDICILYV